MITTLFIKKMMILIKDLISWDKAYKEQIANFKILKIK